MNYKKKQFKKTVRLTNIPLRGHKKLFIALKKIKGVNDYRIKILLKLSALHTPIKKKRLLLKLKRRRLERLSRRLEGYTKPLGANSVRGIIGKKMRVNKKVIIKFKKKGVLKRIKVKKSFLIGKKVKILKYWKKENRWRVGLKLNRLVLKNIRRHKRLNTHKGLRHQFRLPVRGQRTRSNRKTRAYMTYNKL